MFEVQKVQDKVLYRYIDGLSYCRDKPFLLKYKIIRATEKCYFIETSGYNPRRVSKEGKNIFAWDSEEKALFNYYKRKQKQIEILEHRLEAARNNLRWSEQKMYFDKKVTEENPTSVILEKMK